jgi:hypothetical protein
LDKKRFKGHHHKLLPIRYGPYTILDKIGENAYRLDLPPQLGIHNVINVNHLKLFEPPLLEEPVTITHPVDNILDFQLPLAKDTLLDTQTRSTRHRAYTSYLVASQGQTPAQAKWITAEVLHNKFPHLLMEAWDASRSKQGGIGPRRPPRGTPTWGTHFSQLGSTHFTFFMLFKYAYVNKWFPEYIR